MLVGILEKEGLKLEPDASFNPFRKPVELSPKDLSYREVDRLSKLPVGSRERIVCRCEQVTEGEIADSMDRGIAVNTVDGIKRRTRAAMGWCQGTFCRARIAEAMERLTGELPDGSYDIERSGVSRVGKHDFLDFLKARKEE
jgi:glycerol-3-phosphate dehydrogenase